MAEIDAGSLGTQVDVAPEPKVSQSKARRYWAAVATAVVPGLGQFLLGMKQQGEILLVAFLVVVAAMWPFRVLAHYWGYVLTACSLLALAIYSVCNTLQGQSRVVPSRPSRWWFLAFVPLGIAGVSADYAVLSWVAGFRDFSIPSTSMQPTLVQGDRFLVDTRYYRSRPPASGDIVTFYRDNTYFVKRVIGVGGDTIQGQNGKVYLNGRLLDEPYVVHIHGGSEVPELNTFGPITVPVGQYFVIGDNRDVSYDSRSHNYGPVTRGMITGKPLYIFSFASDRLQKLSRGH